MKITELKTLQFKSQSRQAQNPWGYWIYPRKMLAAGPRESTTTLTELCTDTGTSGYWIDSGVSPWLEDLLVGADPMNREMFWQTSNGNTLIDHLLWDFAGRYLEQPVQ